MKLLCNFIFVLMTSVVSANVFYLDPVNGQLSNDGSIDAPWSSLSDVINADYISTNQYSPLPFDANSVLIIKNPNGFVKAGDTLILREGLHGSIFLNNYINEMPITIMTEHDEMAILQNVHLRACKNWVFKGVHVSSEPYGSYFNSHLFFIESHGWQGPSSHITVENCEIYSSIEPWSVAQDWLDNVGNGLYIRGDSCIARGNIIRNIDMGLSCIGDYIIAEENDISNFSGDGGRILGSHIVFNYNTIKDNYDVDVNHDDGIQSFTTNGYIVDNNEVIGNLIINTTDESRPLIGPLQGIACFDGFYNDWVVANNVISVNHWHGISFLGAHRCTIIHNTVIDPTPDITPGGSWIRIDDHKDGSPSSDCLVANNVANQFNVDGNEINNFVVDSYAEYDEHFIDFLQYDFKLLSTSSFIDAADPIYSLSYDFDGNARDENPDIGAYEFQINSSSSPIESNFNKGIVYPNPFKDEVFFVGIDNSAFIDVFDIQGRLLFSGNLETINKSLYSLDSGIYFFSIQDQHGSRIAKAIKY